MSITFETRKATPDLAGFESCIKQSHLSFWQSSSPLNIADVTMSIPVECIDELTFAVKNTGDGETPDIADASQFAACISFSKKIRQALSHAGPGVVLLDKVPAEQFNEMDNRRICGMLASFVGPLMPQSHSGVTLYDVKNKNPANPDKVRKSITNLAQPYHTDGGWYKTPAKHVGLYCVRSARTGGGSRVTSIMSAVQQMISAEPDLFASLLHSAPWDRQGEHSKGECETEALPMFEYRDGEMLSRYYESYIRNGFKKHGSEMGADLDKALTYLDQIIQAQPYLSFEMRSGQFQYLNNWAVLHGRGAFDSVGHTRSHKQRHVIRVWNR